MSQQALHFDVVGVIESPYKEKFATPRQPNLVQDAHARIKIQPAYNKLEAFYGLESFSHIWLMFLFNQTADKGWKPLVRPPRLGGNNKLGVFATRSTFRPNPVGLSAVKLESISQENNQIYINVSGIDLIDNTPIIDIKPYITYSDSIPNATSSYAQDKQKGFDKVEIAPEIEAILEQDIHSLNFIKQTLIQDPRPAYKRNKPDEKVYGSELGAYNVKWQVKENTCYIINLVKL